MLNRVVLIGRLTKDPELRFLTTGTAICTFTLAVDRPKYKDKDKETDFLNCQAWGKVAESCANYLAKGKMAAVDGQIRIETWEKDGERKYKTVINAENVRFLSPKSEVPSEMRLEEMDINSDDLPF